MHQGIRGVASLYYVTFVGSQLPSSQNRTVAAIVGFVVLASTVLYETTADLVDRALLGHYVAEAQQKELNRKSKPER